ncbi:MAG: hypothetical protein V4710_19000 [Verrucomicrobiota bacterium]
MKQLLTHLGRHRAFYAWLPVSIGMLMGSIWGYTALTGRVPSDPSSQPDALIALAYRFMVCVLALALTDLVKTKESLNRAFETNSNRGAFGAIGAKLPSWQHYTTSRLQTVLLIALFCYVLTH